MREVVILSAVRTPIGSFLGTLGTVPATKLGTVAIREAVARAGIKPEQLDEVLMGCVLTGAQGQAPGRQAAIRGGVPASVPCVTVNKVCGSSMKTIIMGTQAIRCGDAELVLAGGMESMSTAPYALDKARTGYRMGNGNITDMMVYDGLWDPYNDFHMGNAAELCSRECGIPRQTQDEYALESYRRAQAAIAEGRFKEEIIAVEVPQRKGDSILVDTDEEPGRSPLEKLPGLKPAFEKDGTVTAGNASSINDGAAAVVLASAEKAEELGAKPLARIVGYGGKAQAPEWFTTAPIGAIEDALKNVKMTKDEIDVWEINEAFAVVAINTIRTFDLDTAKVNVNGGAVALGHPIGATGARLVVTLLHAMKQQGGRYGLATPCIGGGEALAVVVERFA
jgi:acetyl-CoA C-acetyltransferase